MAQMRLDSLGHEVKNSVSITNERGDLIEYTIYSEGDTLKEKYSYDSNHHITKVQASKNDSVWRLKSKRVQDEKRNRETIFEYDEDGTVYRTEYMNDSYGNNIWNKFYQDDHLKYIHLFYWNAPCMPDSIVRFDSDSNRTGEKKVFKYSEDLLVEKTSYKDGEVIEIEKFRYNELGLRELTIYELRNSYRYSTTIEYDGELPVAETSIYTSLPYSYADTTRYIWKYR